MTEMNSKKGNFRLILLAVFVGIISAVAGVSLWNVMQNAPRSSDATLLVLPEPRVIADFALTDDGGNDFSLDNLRGQWSLVFFGFTHCPDVCPTALYQLKQVHEKLAAKSGAEAPTHQVLFVSVDPERDTPEKLGEYVHYFHTDFTGLTGPHEQLQPLTMQLGIAYRIEPHEDGVPYDVNHSASVQLINPQGQLHGVFPAPHDANTMARELSAVMR